MSRHLTELVADALDSLADLATAVADVQARLDLVESREPPEHHRDRDDHDHDWTGRAIGWETTADGAPPERSEPPPLVGLDRAVHDEIRRCTRVEAEITRGTRKRRPPRDPAARAAAGRRLLLGRKIGTGRGFIKRETWIRLHGREPSPKDYG